MSKGKPPSTRSPQEKKALSYAKDRRSVYGENNKASRKLVRLRRAQASRKVRRKVGQDLHVLETLEQEKADVAESSARQDLHRLGGWRKGADVPLAEFLKRRAEWERRWGDGRDEPTP